MSTYAQNIYSPSPSTLFLIVGSGDNKKARSDFLGGCGTSRDEALFVQPCSGG